MENFQRREEWYPIVPCVLNYIIKIFCDVISHFLRAAWSKQRLRASSFTPFYDAKSSAFKITRLIYVHCVSKEDFSVHLKGFSCAALMCKEIHFSYLESMSKRRVCLLPKYIEDSSVEELFSGVSSPALIRMNSSCDITVSIYSYSFFPHRKP